MPDESGETDLRSVLVSGARTMAVRYSILAPKFKAVGWMQPEDHVSPKNIADAHAAQGVGHRFLKLSHHASIFGSGVVLFVVQERALSKLEPSTNGDFALASPLATALSGAAGGAAYSVCATSVAAWLGTGDNSLLQLRSWAFMRRALPFTLPRDAGGFACYFGVYKLAQDAAARRLQHDRSGSTEDTARMKLTSASDILLGLLVAAGSGGVAGLATYAWRSPWDTLYKREVRWRAANAPLWSITRFVSSPRGLKAVLVGASTWAVYELADAALRKLASPL